MTTDNSPPDRSGTPPKFRRRAEARPDEILDAALALFSEGGFDATRMDDVARRAGLSKGAVYLYFPSKTALLEGLVRRAIVPVAEQFSDPAIAAVPKIVLREAITAPQIVRMYREEVLDRAIPVLTTVIATGVKDGHIRPEGELGIDRLVRNHLEILFEGLACEREE